MDVALRPRLHWLALHGFMRGVASLGARRGDLQARLIADPTVKADPVSFYEEVRARGPLVRSRVGYITADHAIGHELLRSDNFHPDVVECYRGAFNIGRPSMQIFDVRKPPHGDRRGVGLARITTECRRIAHPQASTCHANPTP